MLNRVRFHLRSHSSLHDLTHTVVPTRTEGTQRTTPVLLFQDHIPQRPRDSHLLTQRRRLPRTFHPGLFGGTQPVLFGSVSPFRHSTHIKHRSLHGPPKGIILRNLRTCGLLFCAQSMKRGDSLHSSTHTRRRRDQTPSDSPT